MGVAKAEHECGLPAALYRYTRGKTRGYGNSRVRVTCHDRSTRIWVLVLGLRVLATSTFETEVFILFYCIYLFIIYITRFDVLSSGAGSFISLRKLC